MSVYDMLTNTGRKPSDLTTDELVFLAKLNKIQTNGCGPGSWVNIFLNRPFWLFGTSFRRACKRHAILYGIGGDEGDRKLADTQFFNDLRNICKARFKWLWRCGIHYGYTTAAAYYKAVREGGAKYFNFKGEK